MAESFFFFRNLDFGKETQRHKVVVVVSQYRHVNDACSWLKAVRIQEPLYLRLPSFIRDIQHPYTVKLVFAFVQICESNYSLKPHSDGQWHHSSVEGPEQCWLSLSFAARPGYKCNSQLWTKTSPSTTMPGMEASNNLSRMMGWRPEQTIGNWVQKKHCGNCSRLRGLHSLLLATSRRNWLYQLLSCKDTKKQLW